MKKILFCFFTFIFTFTSCNFRDNEIPINTNMADIDNYLMKVNQLSKHIFSLKNNDKNFYAKSESLREIIKLRNVSEDKLYSILDSNFNVKKETLRELEILAAKLNTDFLGDENKMELMLKERFQKLSNENIIDLSYLPDTKGVIKARCNWWTAASGVIKAAGSLAGGCLGGPLGCAIGGAVAVVEIVDTTMKLCADCGC